MAASSLFALIDDIATLLDDVAVMSKVAMKKTAGVLGDDLALNAEQVLGLSAERELPVVWAVAKGSLVNKAILVPAALGISLFTPWATTPLLMLGGLFLCFEGCEKIAHKLSKEHHKELVRAVVNPAIDLVEFEKSKIKGAIRTDFILSAEIIVISLGTLTNASMTVRVITLTAIALLMTIGVYGLVGGIVKLDDLGIHLHRSAGKMKHRLGAAILWFAPRLMKALSSLGTTAMFLVGGSILVHGIPPFHHLVESLGSWAFVAELAVGMLAGAIVLACVRAVSFLRKRSAPLP